MTSSAKIALRADFGLLFLVLLVIAAGNTALQSVLPAIGRAIGIRDTMVALAFSASAVLWTFSAPFWAGRSSQHGRKGLVRLGLAGYVISMTASGIVILAGIRHHISPVATFAGFILMRSLFGLFGSAANPAAQAYIADRTTPAERTSALATLSSAFGLGTIFGPLIGGIILIPALGLSQPLFLFALLAAFTLVIVSRKLPDDNPMSGGSESFPQGRTRLRWRDSRLMPFLIFGAVAGNVQAATGQTMGFLIIDLLHMQPSAAQSFISVAIAAGAASTVLAQWGLIPMLGLNPAQLMRWGAGLAAAGCLLTGLAHSYAAVVTGFALSSLGFGFCRPGFTAGASLAMPVEQQDGVAGAVTSINGASFIIAPVAGVSLYHLHPAAPFIAAFVLLVLLTLYVRQNVQVERAKGESSISPTSLD